MMRHLLIFLTLATAVLTGMGQSLADYRAMFTDQLRLTCLDGATWEKSVTDRQGSRGKQTRTFEVDCRTGYLTDRANGERMDATFGEFEPLFKFAWNSPYNADYMSTYASGESIYAWAKIADADDIELQRQVFEVDAGTGMLKYAEARISKSNLLYDYDLHIEVWFGPDGRYLRHRTETFTDVALSSPVHTLIEGRRID